MGLIKTLVTGLLLLGAQFAAAGSVYLLATRPHWWLVAAVLVFVATLVAYGFIMLMSFILKHGQRPEFAALVGEPVALPPHLEAFTKAFLLLVGYPLDWLLNAAVFTVLLLYPPAEPTVTDRLKKFVHHSGPRGRVARYFARVWVNPPELASRPHVHIPQDMKEAP